MQSPQKVDAVCGMGRQGCDMEFRWLKDAAAKMIVNVKYLKFWRPPAVCNQGLVVTQSIECCVFYSDDEGSALVI